MGMEQIRHSRGVPAKRGGRIRYTGGRVPEMGTIVSARNGYLMIRIDGEKLPGTYHPTWELEYLDDDGKAIWPKRGRWKSIAVWPDSVNVGTADNRSTDEHATESAAIAVCNMLQKAGFGGEGKVFPTSTWVELIEEGE